MEEFIGSAVKINLKDTKFSRVCGVIVDIDVDTQKIVINEAIALNGKGYVEIGKHELYGGMIKDIQIIGRDKNWKSKELKAARGSAFEKNLEQNGREKKEYVDVEKKIEEADMRGEAEKLKEESLKQREKLVKMMGSLTVEKKIGGENESNKEKRKEEADMSSYSRQQGQNGRYTPKQRERNGKVYNSGSKGKGTKDTWMNEDVSRYNQEFDFEANLMLFDKKTIFEEIRNKESKDESELLVNINKPKGSQSKTPVAAGWKESGVGMGVAVGVGGGGMGGGIGGFRGAKGEKVGVMEAAEWKRVEEYAKKEYGIDEQVIIEMAGYLGAEKICKEMERGGRVLVIAGNGRNGSYGLTAAKRLVNKGYEVDVILMFRSKRKTSAMNTQLVKTIKANGGKIYKEIAKYEGLDKVEVVVDAIYSANSSDSINRRNVQKVAGLIEKNGARGHRTKLVSFEYPLIRGVLANTLRIEELRQEEGGMSSSFSTDSESEGSERGGSKDSQGRYGGESIIASSHVIVFGVPNRSVQQQVVGSRVYVADIGMPQTAYKAVFGNNKDVMDNKNIFRQSSMVEIKSL